MQSGWIAHVDGWIDVNQRVDGGVRHSFLDRLSQIRIK